MKVFFDSNVIIDALTNREGAVDCERKLLYAATVGEIEGVVSAKQMTDIYYVLRKYISSDPARRDLLSILLNGLQILPLDKAILSEALKSPIPDYEDAVIGICASACNAAAIVSNDKEGFDNSQIKAVSPQELAKRLGL